MMLGLGLSLCSRGGAGSFDPATLPLTGWWRDYAGSPWNGTASAGASSGRVMSATSGPTTPATITVDSHGGMSADGVGTFLREPTLTASSYFSASAYSIVMLVRPFAGNAPDVNRYVDQQLFAELSDLLGISWTTSGVSAWHYDGTNFNGTAFKAAAASAFHMVAVTFSGGTLSCSVDNGTPATLSKNNVNNLTMTINLSRSRSAGTPTFCREDALELMLSDTALSAGNLTSIYSYFKTRYPSAGLP